MQHQLPDLKDLIQEDCSFIHGEQELKEFSLTNVSYIFYKKNTEFFYTPVYALRKHLPFEQSSWRHTISVYKEDAFAHIIPLLCKWDILPVENEHSQPIGYLHASNVLHKIYQSYNYLQAYFNAIMQTTDASVSIIDKEGNTDVWTKGAERIFSVKEKDIVGKPMTNFFPTNMLQTLKALETGESVYQQQHQPRQDLFVLINSEPILLDDNVVGAIAAETDITSQVRLNQELFNANSKIQQLQQEMTKLSPADDPFQHIKGTSSAIEKTMENIKKVGATDVTALIVGESGVGKELFAKAVHDIRESPKSPYIVLNCGAIVRSLFESELFGYEKGAFSGANPKGKKGKIEMARGGTLFLDEIGEMPFEMQVKLLRVLEEKTYFPVGGTKEINADCRIIAATNRDLKALVDEGTFREDLYYRINIVTIRIPPLRERKEDIIALTHLFLHEFSMRYNQPIQDIPKTLMQTIFQYNWPGNVRELRNAIERLVVFSSNGAINEEDLPFSVDRAKKTEDFLPIEGALSPSLQEEMQAHERKVIEQTLEQEEDNKLAAAKRLGVSRATLYNKMKKLQISTFSKPE